MFVCVARLTLQIHESGSLKAKRQVVHRVTERVKKRFNVAVAEVGDQDLWQKATLGLAVVSNERAHVDEQMEKIIHLVEEMYIAPLVTREKEILSFGDKLYYQEVGPTSSEAAADKAQDQEEGLSTEELIASLNRAERSMAEAEGMADWERRHEGKESVGKPSPSGGGPLTLDEARARARTLRNPRDWEKK